MSFIVLDGYQKSTANLPEKEQFDFWREAVCDEFVKLDCKQTEAGSFNGEIRGGIGVPNLKFSEVFSDPQVVERSKYQISKSTEAEFLISFQLAKQGVVRQSGREALLKPGHFALYDSTQPYTLTFNERFHQFIVQMPHEVLSRHLVNPEQYTAIPISGESGLGSVLTSFIFSLVREINSAQRVPAELSENLVNMIAMAFSSSIMLDQFGDQSAVRDSLKQRILQYIDNNLCDTGLTNQCIADSQGISIRYLHKLFQGEEETLHALILNRRLEKGRQLLQDPNHIGNSIEQIAYSLGFVSPSHFSRSFKKHFGVSPSDYR